MDFLVGTFNHPSLYLLHFHPSTSSLTLIKQHPALSPHSWLSLSSDKKNLYATAWTSPPSIASYSISVASPSSSSFSSPSSSSSTGDGGGGGGRVREIRFLNAKPVRALPGYVCNNSSHVFSVSGPGGEVFEKEVGGGGALGREVQRLEFVEEEEGEGEGGARGGVPHGEFGGLRFGAHSVDLSVDGKGLFVADIGRNCIWTYRVLSEEEEEVEEEEEERKGEAVLEFGMKCVAPRRNDGPRHTWPHPNGRVLYSLQEHSSMVDVFAIAEDGVTLGPHLQGCSVLPAGKDCRDYWADEVRVSTGPDSKTPPRFLYASNRGLEKGTKGYVVAYALNEDGTLKSEEALDIWETPTSGGIANAIEPAPWREEHGGVEFLALCDSEEGWVSVLSFDGSKIREVAKVNLGTTEEGKVVGAATPVWL